MHSFTIASLVLLSTLNMVMPIWYDARDSSNAFRDSRSSHVTYGKAPDGKCYKRVVTIVNGKQHDKIEWVDCAEAERQMKAEQERTQHKINEEFSKVHEDIKKTQKSIEDQIKQSMGSFDLDL